MTDMFAEEIEGLVALGGGRTSKFEVRLTHPRAAGVTFLPTTPNPTHDSGWRVTLGDLYATSPKSVGLIFHVERRDGAGVKPRFAEVRPSGRTRSPRRASNTRFITLPVFANLDGTDHVEPVVERTLIRFEARAGAEEAIEHADRGDLAQAAHTLAEASIKLDP